MVTESVKVEGGLSGTVDPGAEARTRDLQEDLFAGLKKVSDNLSMPQELWRGGTAVPL